MTKRSAEERDDTYIKRAQKRAQKAYRRLGTVRKVGAELGVNHGWVSAWLRHGSVPKSEALRLKLGLPLVLPSEREARKKMEMTLEEYKELLKNRVNKYGAVRTEVDGFVFASRAEARRYGELKLMEQAGEISELALQVTYSLDVNGVHVCDYVADFVYRPTPPHPRPLPIGKSADGEGRVVVEDVKGKRTKEYVLKKKLMLAVHGIEIVES